MTGEHTSNPPPDGERKRGARGKPDWSRHAKAQPPALRQLRPQEPRGAPGPAGGVRAVFQQVPGRRNDPRAVTKAAQAEIWRWNASRGGRPCAAVAAPLDVPAQGVRERRPRRFRDHVVVGSWKIAGALELVDRRRRADGVPRALARARSRLSPGKDPSRVPRGFSIVVLPPEQNWMEPAGRGVHC